ncbi:D-alanine--D-alanine ligase [Undibacterium sp. RuRC25W]|uniref:D-alanine--D-alanine ligase n=1 Tax=Undibacterium sp. RuRC25W TaxID=3413047 RepID=UPI003BF3315D
MMSELNIKSLGKVGVLFGGRSAEHDISVMSGTGVLAALKARGVDAHPFDPSQRNVAELAAEKFDRVFIALHGRYGEDGTLQGVLEQLNIPYTGSGVMASAIAMDKIFTKRIWQTHGLSTPKYAVLTPETSLREVPDELGLPLIIKPPHEGSTIGITKVKGYSEMQDAYALAAQFDDVVLAEEFVEGRELTIAILGRGKGAYALPIIEIVAPDGNYDYQNKYFTDDTKYLCPAPLDNELTAEIQQMAVDAYRSLDCEGWARVDVLLRKSDNKPFLLEINTSPGMTGHSLVPMAAKATGLSYEDICLEILKTARLKIHTEAK